MAELSPAARDAADVILLRIERDEVEVPLLPEVARKVLRIVNDPESDAAQLANIIQSDQSMAAHILRIANSPAYTPAGNIVSLQQAISRLGMQTMSEVAIAASVNAKMFHAPGFEKRIHTIWSNSLLTGLWSKEIARLTRRNVDAAFLCGLLHNVGRPMLLQWLSESEAVLTEEDTLAIENELLVTANRAVVESWKLPGAVMKGVCEYVGKLSALPEQGLMVRAGILMAQWMLGNIEANPSDDEQHGEALALLTLYADDIDKLRAMLDDVKASQEAMRI